MNTVVPGATGQAPSGAPVDDSMVVRVAGYIAGIGATHTLRVASYRAQRAALKAQVVGSGTLVTLTATAPTLGLTGSEVGTLTAQFQRFVQPTPAIGDEVAELVIELLCMSDPVAWAVA